MEKEIRPKDPAESAKTADRSQERSEERVTAAKKFFRRLGAKRFFR